MDDHLTTDFNEACFLVDLSNVVRDRRLGEPGARSLRRLRLLVDAAKALARDPDVKLYLVADRSLRHGGRREFSDLGDIRQLGSWVRRGLVEELPDADDRLLELCELTGIPVITGDRFRGARGERPWLQGNTDDFLEPLPGPGGTVRLAPVDMGVAHASAISMKLEEDVLKKQGLLDTQRRPRFDVVSRNWRCEEGRCTLYDTTKGSAALLPRMRGTAPTCEMHGGVLVDDGPRTATVQLKLLLDGELKARFTLENGTTVPVGRAPGPGGIALHGLVPPGRTTGLSRVHLTLRISDGLVHVLDRSSYGTTRLRSMAGRGGPGRWRGLGAAEERFGGGDELLLVEGVVLARSGRRFPTELAQEWQRRRPLPPGAAEVTRMR
ncbi:FHA domain-containing protein [Streptomyces sp. NPDC060322]|uniref:FHA domain-containing protein n=1 Tax=Streptomyces sp. NPDC060322 TaxID=3347097 RepID=UPI00365BF6AB